MQILIKSPQVMLKRIFPVHVESDNHNFTVQDLVPRPSPPVVRSVKRFLSVHGLIHTQQLIPQKSVKDSISGLLQIQGARLWGDGNSADPQEPNIEAEAFEMLKTFYLPEDLPSQEEVCDLVHKFKPVAEDICRIVDEAHIEHSGCKTIFENQIHSEDSSKTMSRGTASLVFAEQSSLSQTRPSYTNLL